MGTASAPRLEPVQAPLVDDKWHFAESWVKSAVEEYALLETVGSYKTRCVEGTAQLWLIVDHDQVVGAAITEVYNTPAGLTCAVPVVAAVSLDEALVPCFEQIESWARAEGCTRMSGYGRLGWVGALKPYGWRPRAVEIEKDI
jgi:hypothetical protein